MSVPGGGGTRGWIGGQHQPVVLPDGAQPGLVWGRLHGLRAIEVQERNQDPANVWTGQCDGQ